MSKRQSSDQNSSKTAGVVIETRLAKLSKFAKYTVARVNRSQFKNAPYNPRIIDEFARAKLRDGIKYLGLIEPLVWNRLTGNLIAGHQRISILDQLEQTQDYSLDVAIVELDEKREREANVFLNNPNAQGTFDYAAMQSLIEGGVVDVERLGFDAAQMQIMMDAFADQAQAAANEATGDIVNLFTKAERKDKQSKAMGEIEGMKERKRQWRDQDRAEREPEFYTVLVFTTRARMMKFFEKTKLPTDERYIDGERLALAMGVVLDD